MSTEPSRASQSPPAMDNTDIELVFRMIDRNNSGKINYRELRKFCKQYHSQWSKKEVKALLAKIDVDGDGKITLNELKAAIFTEAF
ncbi:unnamed protein product [Echinostoma caproni]|uniref:EF hand n=1 Tax=Echinostoma caproni TaxID=27848 RepID=A0A183A648_9TREM|nr:unnamed protein product [Echinostoma caproni]